MPRRSSLIGLLLAPALILSAQADGVTEFYRGRTVTMIVGSTAGGGYDLNARVLAAHLGPHIPGRPTFVVQNMPGAGGRKLANYMFTVAPRNGTIIAILQRNLTVEPLFTPQDYDGTKFTWLGSSSRDVSTCISWHTAKVKTWDDLMREQFIAGGQSAGADADVFTLTLKNVFGIKARLISGFPGTNEMMLAMERGEIDGMCGVSYSTLKSRHEDWLRGHRINILIQAGLQSEPALPDVPSMLDLAKDAEQRQMIRLIVGTQAMARPFLAPPGIPADRKAALRTAFDATMKDPTFIADARKLEADVSPMTGGEIDALLGELYATPKAIVSMAARATAEP